MEQQHQRCLCSLNPGRSAHCGAGVSTSPPNMLLSITSTTGSPVELNVPRGETVEGLRTRVSQKLRIQTDRIALLHKDRQLTAGKLLDLGVTDGSKLTLVPVVEAGIACSTARAERNIMDVLESLTEVQISNFLSGHSPLTLNLGIGGHVMYVQLQLSAQNVADLQQHHQQQQNQEIRARRKRELQTCQPASRVPPHDSSSSTAGFTTPPAARGSAQEPDSCVPVTLNSQRNRISSNSTAPTSCSSPTYPGNHYYCESPHPSCPPRTEHTSSPVISTPSLPSAHPNPCSPLQAATPVCSSLPTGSIPGTPSPPPASTFNECNIHSSSPAEPCKPPGAVIESFVNHSPGVFSGTFSGTLAPCSESNVTHARGGISIILQILNDLLRAAVQHPGPPPASLHQHRPSSNLGVSQLLTGEEQSKTKQKTLQPSKTSDEKSGSLHAPTQENRELHCKLEHLQFLMQQRRTRRRTRRSSHLSPSSHPYQHTHHWS